MDSKILLSTTEWNTVFFVLFVNTVITAIRSIIIMRIIIVH